MHTFDIQRTVERRTDTAPTLGGTKSTGGTEVEDRPTEDEQTRDDGLGAIDTHNNSLGMMM